MTTQKAEYHWLTTAPSGKAHTHGADQGQTGWRLHAVYAESGASLESIKHQSAICGVRPGSGWGLDLFIDRRCARCVQRMQKFGFLPRDGDQSIEPSGWRPL